MTAGKVTRIAGGGLRITALEIRNLWGVAEAAILPGKRTIIRGANGSGKSSVLNAIQLALGGGTLGKYQRIGSLEEPEIVLEIEGPSDHIRIEREGDKPPKVLRRVGDSEAFEKVSAPATFLKGLFDVRGANPFLFLQASDDDRAQLLLEALDIRMDEDALAELLGEDAGLAFAVPSNLHPLIRLSLIHDAIYSARRGCNVDAEGKAKAAEQLKRSVPHERIPDVAAEIASIEGKVIDGAADIAREEEANDATLARAIAGALELEAAERADLTNTHNQELAVLRADHDRWASALRAETERTVVDRERSLNLEINERRSRVRELGDRVDAVAAEKCNIARENREKLRVHEVENREHLTSARERLAGLRAQQAEVTRHENTRTQIASFEEAAKRHEADSERCSMKLRGLEDLKRQLASNLPIEGLDISGKEIRVNGVPWRDLNKAQQGGIAGLVAIERAKRSRLRVIFFDEAERFDQEHLDAVADAVEAAGAQLFAAVVAREGELTIEADGEQTGSVKMDAPADPVVRR